MVYAKTKKKFKTERNGLTFYSTNEKECAEKYDEYIVTNGFDKPLNFPENYPTYTPNLIIKTFKEDIDEKTCVIKFKSGKQTYISPESYEKIKYGVLSHTDYVHIKIGGKNYRLHRYLLDEFDRDVFVDHDDSNPFNNRIENLRKTNSKGNGENKKKRKNSSTNYVNVVKSDNGEKFITRISNSTIKNYHKTHLTEEYAARDRDLQIMKQAPNSLYKLYFKEDWEKPGEIEKWEDLLFFEEIDIFFLEKKGRWSKK